MTLRLLRLFLKWICIPGVVLGIGLVFLEKTRRTSIFKGEVNIVVAVLKLKAMWREGRKMGHVSPGVLGTWGLRLQRCLPPRPKQERMSCRAHLLSFVIITRCSDWQLSIEPQHVNLICQCKGPSRTRCPRRPTQRRRTLCPQRKQAPLAALPPSQCCSSWEPSPHTGNPKSHSGTKPLRKAFSKNQLQL